MTLTISSVALGAVNQMFSALDGILKKAAEHAKSKGVDEEVYLNWRLAPDKFPLAQQIRIATEVPSRTLSRLAGVELPDYGADETSFEQLHERIAKARADIMALSSDALDADPEGPITFPVGGDNEMTLPRQTYLQNFILPNLYFHVTATHVILRNIGVDIGKRDFLAVPQG